MSVLVKIILVLFLLCLSGLFSGSEVAYFSLSKILRKKLEYEKSVYARRANLLLANPNDFLTGILVGNTIVNVAATTIVTAILISFLGDQALKIAIPLMSFVLLIFGEITPKNFAVNYNFVFAKAVAIPLSIILALLSPIRLVLRLVTGFFVEGTNGKSLQVTLNEADYKAAIGAGFSGGFISLPMRESLIRLLEIDRITAEEVMTARAQLVMLNFDAELKEIIEAFRKGAEFVFIYRDSLDNVIGVIPREKIPFMNKDAKIKDLVDEVCVAAFSTPVSELLREFQKKGTIYAVIIGEHSEIIGGVSLKDVANFFFTEPFESPQVDLHKPRGFTILPATMTLYEFNRFFGSDFASDDVQTIGGFIEEKSGKIPREGESIVVGDFNFKILEADKRKIIRILVKRL